MGLDWNPMSLPRAGFEEELAGIVKQLRSDGERLSAVEKQALHARFREISDPPHTLLGAPRVGIDEAADRWLMEQLEQRGQAERYASVREGMHGYYVLDLLPDCDGFPRYSNYPVSDELDRYSFRGAFLNDVEDVLGSELFTRAWELLLPAELEAYGSALLEKARAFASAHGVESVEHDPPAEFEEDAPATRADILFSAAKWCLYWAKRGHGLEPSY